MALINCPECGKEISDTAKKCTHCGYTLKGGKKRTPMIAIVIVIILIAAVVAGALYFYRPWNNMSNSSSVNSTSDDTSDNEPETTHKQTLSEIENDYHIIEDGVSIITDLSESDDKVTGTMKFTFFDYEDGMDMTAYKKANEDYMNDMIRILKAALQEDGYEIEKLTATCLDYNITVTYP